jgi:hypothetical protein
MGYDKSLDKEIKVEDVELDGGNKIRVAVYSYNGGEAKLQIGPRIFTNTRNGKPRYNKLGRMTLDETAKVLKAVFRCQTDLEAV